MSDVEQHFEEEEFTTEFNGRLVSRILRQGLAHWPYMIGFLVSIMVVSGMESYFTYLTKRIVDEGIIPRDLDALTAIVTQYAALFVIFAVFVFAFIFCAGMLGQKVQYDLRRALFNHLQRLSLSYFDRTPTGWLMSRVTSDTQRVGELVSWGFLDIVWGIVNVITAMYFMLLINWKLALVVLAMLPLLLYVSTQFKKRILVEYRQVRRLNSKITGAYNENITGVRVVKALRREEANLEAFDGLTGNMYRASFKAAWLAALFLPAVQIISAGAVAAVLWSSGRQFEQGAMTIGGIQAFVSYITFMLWPIQEMARVYAEMQQAVASGERIFSLLDAEPEIVDRPAARAPVSLRGDIRFEGVDFQYEEGKPVLRDFSLHVRQGETIALVGPTGAGKSTIVNLVCRFYEPTGGRILINDIDYRNLTLHAIQSRIGMVLQTPHLFSGTIFENLRYGRLDATEDDVVVAAQMAGAHGFISQLPDGYATEVGEGGVLLSVGQKQLISLARAILVQPDIFIMDEATSSVDTLTEALIQQAMEQLMADSTSFIIAHRLSTIRRADRILVIEKGGISELGSHEDLLRRRGHYYELYTRQFRDERSRALGLTAVG